MDDILLTDSETYFRKNVWWSKENFALFGIATAPGWKKPQRGDSINYLGYKKGLQKNQPQKV